MQDTSTIFTRWAFALVQNYDFKVKHVRGKLNVVPDMLSRAFSEVNGEAIPSEPRLAAICRNVPIDGPYYPLWPSEYEIAASNVQDDAPLENDRKLFMSAVSVFPHVDPAKLVNLQKEEFCPYFEYLRAPTSAPLPNGESKYTMSYFFLNEGMLFQSYLPGHLRKRSTFRDQLVVPTACLLYTSPSPRDKRQSRMPSSA